MDCTHDCMHEHAHIEAATGGTWSEYEVHGDRLDVLKEEPSKPAVFVRCLDCRQTFKVTAYTKNERLQQIRALVVEHTHVL